MSNQRIYLDNAATSWPKPDSVYDSVDQYQRNVGVPYGRGGYSDATTIGRTIDQLRVELAQFIDAAAAQQIVFTYSGTDSLNFAIQGTLRPGDHVVTTNAEHNSVLRPLRFLEQQTANAISVTRVPLNSEGVFSADDIVAAIEPNTRLVSVIQASNVTGAIQPIEAVGRHIGEATDSPLLLVDAAQSLGHMPISVQELGCDLLATPGHKGMLAPTGTGLLYVGERAKNVLKPYRQGGTGTESERDTQPTEMPARFESGNHNVPGLVGMAAGLAYIRERGIDQIREHEVALMAQLSERLEAFPHVKTYGPESPSDRVGVLSLNVTGVDPQELAAILDTSLGVQCRSGLHCAPLIHEAIGTKELGGTLRLSVGPFSTIEHVDAVADLLCQMG